MKYQKVQLQATFEILKWPHEIISSTKPKIVNDIVCRIQNSLPEKCDICNESYRTKLGDKHLLACAICGQEAHQPCILNLIDKCTGDDVSAEDAKKLINPIALKNVHYLCKGCGETTIPGDGTSNLQTD